MSLISTPVGSPEHWGEKVVQRALLDRAHAVATRITTYTEDPANTPHQLITGSRRALVDLTALRTRWQRVYRAPRRSPGLDHHPEPHRPQPAPSDEPSRSGRPHAGRSANLENPCAVDRASVVGE
ncbi:hypothetical protein ACFW1M_17205 [Streptomyces inhibens]|uniref:hypothetical protein n=1 Tax=Streptomyces inhibens TaxID=2293571 RepID=UPI003683CAF9